ncbi:ParB/RepB/Spo0J family partition protein|uniref:Chromosome partitioning protein, ParB family n=1 Tax=Dendrosporobacter quercicolus TaxID=146817 RepID=A0A1G9ZVM2_9FIRM|nr:ParB/RepB/Spo0J family partition protein [Dendrosporobacter quercicolus]NSL49604.1 ParB/RepB/Spo0J family partition protein [Dendrosporobacter quercicolus DSM 1736]SDN24586.1 chromosome partitioning protein, ParB family [Dendrosporobacter quercicolus]
MITNIEIKRISPHPDNPRKDLGDLTELANSIKANGILQNLTVVPYLGEVTGQPIEGVYRVVIGHRRLAAAKLAGLTEVPCVITDMDYKKQLSTMLLENMQRNDLTILEQAQGFQMMLDFGETVDGISEQTGFSESTIRRRVKLLDLDKEKFQQSVARGATLQDYAELDKIKDVKTKNKVLEKIGTPNFHWELKDAIDKEKFEENKALLIAELEKFATQVKETAGLRSVRWFSNFSTELKNLKPVDADTREYFFTVSPYNAQLLVKEAEKTDTEAEKAMQEKQRQLRERRERLDEINKRAFQLRHEFVRSYVGAKKHINGIMALAMQAIMEGGFPYGAETKFLELLGIKAPEDEELTFDTISGVLESEPERVLLIAAYCSIENQHENYHDWQCEFSGSAELDVIYDCLEKKGYELSEEERALRDGTHELYVQQTALP